MLGYPAYRATPDALRNLSESLALIYSFCFIFHYPPLTFTPCILCSNHIKFSILPKHALLHFCTFAQQTSLPPATFASWHNSIHLTKTWAGHFLDTFPYSSSTVLHRAPSSCCQNILYILITGLCYNPASSLKAENPFHPIHPFITNT